jgi:hypothetical protein
MVKWYSTLNFIVQEYRLHKLVTISEFERGIRVFLVVKVKVKEALCRPLRPRVE